MDHLWLKDAPEKTVEYQVEQSKKVLRDLLHVPIDSFAYPYGAFDQQAIGIVKRAGFSNAVSTVPGIFHTPDTQYFLYRLRPGYRTGEVLLNFLKQDTFTPW
jgi:peptidoglycan/xylan/chitin deacetylase (PgdA/CDA1 family)